MNSASVQGDELIAEIAVTNRSNYTIIRPDIVSIQLTDRNGNVVASKTNSGTEDILASELEPGQTARYPVSFTAGQFKQNADLSNLTIKLTTDQLYLETVNNPNQTTSARTTQ